MRKRIFFAIVLLLECLIIAFEAAHNQKLSVELLSVESEPGEYLLSDDIDAHDVDIYLSGDWEYYAGSLYYLRADDMERSIEERQDPAYAFDRAFYEMMKNDWKLQLDGELFRRNENAEMTTYIRIPAESFSAIYHHEQEEVSSYRIVVRRFPRISELDMILSFSGFIEGEYRVFINGQPVTAMVAPYEYPTYYFHNPDRDELEIVIQTWKTTQLLNLCPRVSFKGNVMIDMDCYRNRMLILSAALLTSFLMMLLLIFSIDRKYFHIPFLVGLLFTTNGIVNNLWAIGYQDTISGVIPQSMVPFWAWMTAAGALLMGCRMLLTMRQKGPARRGIGVAMGMIAAAATLRLIALVIGTPWVLLACDALAVASVILMIGIMMADLPELSHAACLTETGLLLMTMGVLAVTVNNHYGFWNYSRYIQPVTIIVYIGLIFLNHKKEQTETLRRTKELLEMEKQATKMQTAMLSSQIQPHFLYNTLTSIQELCYSDPDHAAELIVTFSHYLRHNIDFMNYDDLVPFTKELEHIRNYIFIQNARYHQAITYIEKIDFTDFSIPPLSVQPLLENAVKHGIMRDYDHGQVTLEVREEKGYILIRVENDGKKFTRDEQKPNHSLNNIQTRLKHLTGGELNILFDHEGPGTVIEIRIPSENVR